MVSDNTVGCPKGSAWNREASTRGRHKRYSRQRKLREKKQQAISRSHIPLAFEMPHARFRSFVRNRMAEGNKKCCLVCKAEDGSYSYDREESVVTGLAECGAAQPLETVIL